MIRHLIAHDRSPAAPLRSVRSFPPLPRFAVPAYFNPLWDPVGWQSLAALGPALSFAILNPDSGPGRAVDRGYIEPIAAVQSLGGRVIGYVDTGYGRRPTASILRDVRRYQSWYGLRGAFLDQVSSGRDQVARYGRITEAARRAGMDFLVLNPGVTPDPGYAELVDVVVTFEGSWLAYRDHATADWMANHPPERFCHLVHSTPPEEVSAAQDTVRARHVGAFYVTELGGANPWGSLSRQLTQQAAAQRASATQSPPR